MANQTQQPPAQTNAPGPTAEETQEQRIAREHLADLRQQASDAAAETLKARQDAAASKGDLERAKAANAALAEENERLKTALAKQTAAAAKSGDLPALPVDLPKGSAQLVESVTVAVVTEHGPVRGTPKRGDVVIVGKPEDAEELQEEIGELVRVYAVDKKTFDELRTLKHLA